MLLESLKLLYAHKGFALAMACIFSAGAVFSRPALRWRPKALLFVPEWFARKIGRIMDSRPSRLGLGAYIFLFNGAAMFLYMLTGLVPWLPLAVCFWTGLNVALASALGAQQRPRAGVPPSLPFSARISMALTFLIELPCFWFVMALGWTMTTRLSDLLGSANMGSVRERVLAYALVVLPALAVSALAEAHAVVSSLPPPAEGGNVA